MSCFLLFVTLTNLNLFRIRNFFRNTGYGPERLIQPLDLHDAPRNFLAQRGGIDQHDVRPDDEDLLYGSAVSEATRRTGWWAAVMAPHTGGIQPANPTLIFRTVVNMTCYESAKKYYYSRKTETTILLF